MGSQHDLKVPYEVSCRSDCAVCMAKLHLETALPDPTLVGMHRDGGLMSIKPARKLELGASEKPLTAPTPLAGQPRLLSSMASVPAGFSPSNNLLLGSRDR